MGKHTINRIINRINRIINRAINRASKIPSSHSVMKSTVETNHAFAGSHTPGDFAPRSATGRWQWVAAALLGAALIGEAQSASAATNYYRWNDAQGKMVVSDRPPVDKDTEYEVISQGSSLSRRVMPGEGAVPPEVTPRPGNEFEQVNRRQQEMEVIAKNPESCARATDNLDTLNTSARIRIRDPETGEPRFISEEEKETQRQKARDIIRVHCK